MNFKRNEQYIKTFGDHLRKVRKEKRLSQEELAHKAGLTLSQVGRIERGVINTSISTVYTLAEALEIKPKELFSFDME